MVDFQERDSRSALDDLGEENAPGEEAGGDGDADHGEEHDHHGHDLEAVSAAVVTVSTSRDAEEDPSGDAIATALEEGGHEVATRELVEDDLDRIQDLVDGLVDNGGIDAIVTTGGTGVTPDDVTIEAVRPLLGKSLPGFGELFRRRSEEEVGTKVIATRATAGIADGVPVFCLPGSENAARLGAALIAPEVGHLAGLARRDG